MAWLVLLTFPMLGLSAQLHDLCPDTGPLSYLTGEPLADAAAGPVPGADLPAAAHHGKFSHSIHQHDYSQVGPAGSSAGSHAAAPLCLDCGLCLSTALLRDQLAPFSPGNTAPLTHGLLLPERLTLDLIGPPPRVYS